MMRACPRAGRVTRAARPDRHRLEAGGDGGFTLDITIPANTQGRLHARARAAQVSEGGRPIAGRAEIKPVG
jgi:hypothetical protein